MKYSNLDILFNGVNYPNSTKITNIEQDNDKNFIVSIKYPNGKSKVLELNNVDLGLSLNTIEDVKNYLNTKIDKPLLDTDPIGKICMFINDDGEEVWGVCESCNSFTYVLVKDKVKYYTKNFDLVDNYPQDTIIQLATINNRYYLTINQAPYTPKLITKEKYDHLLATKNLKLVPFDHHQKKGMEYYSEI